MSHGSVNTRRAYSLIELLLALSSSAILVAAMGSTIVLAARAVPPGDSASAGIAEANAALQRISDDASVGLALMTGSNMIAFGVPDYTGDGSPDIAVYQIQDGQLTRGDTMNDSDATVLADNVLSLTGTPGTGSQPYYRTLTIVLEVESVGPIRTTVELMPRPSR